MLTPIMWIVVYNCTICQFGQVCLRPKGLKYPIICVNEKISLNLNDFLINPHYLCKNAIEWIYIFITQVLMISILLPCAIFIIIMLFIIKRGQSTPKEMTISAPFKNAERIFTRPKNAPPAPPQGFEDIDLNN